MVNGGEPDRLALADGCACSQSTQTDARACRQCACVGSPRGKRDFATQSRADGSEYFQPTSSLAFSS